MTYHHDTIIIGAGLSGLYTAWLLKQYKNTDVVILESRDRTGGRILAAEFQDCCRFDMGPAWVWPQLQPRLSRLIADLGLSLTRQFTTGDILYERQPGNIERYSGQSSHSYSYRITGSSQALIEGLQSRLDTSCIHLDTRVQSVRLNPLTIHAVRDGKSHEYTANNIIFALPPRLLLQTIDIEPALPDNLIAAWRALPTWMAGHCKVVFIYARPFWREQKLSGEVFSHVGPLAEIYDASPVSEGYYALTSFVGLNAQQRGKLDQTRLIDACMAQLLRLFGPDSQQTIEIRIKDWSQDTFTAADMDLTGPMQHPYYPANMPRSIRNDRLIFAGTELASEHGGYLEGALESAEEAVTRWLASGTPD